MIEEEDRTLIEYHLVDHVYGRRFEMGVDPHMPVSEIIDDLINRLKLPRTDPRTRLPAIYLLCYNQRFLTLSETLFSANIPEGATLDLMASTSTILG